VQRVCIKWLQMLLHLSTQCKKYILFCLHQCKEMDELLAFIFTVLVSQLKMTFAEHQLLVRRNKVAKPLEWSGLNHRDYADLEISYKNLESYPEDSPPVVINFDICTIRFQKATSVHDMELEHGTEEGVCPFTVHTLTSEEYDTMNSEH